VNGAIYAPDDVTQGVAFMLIQVKSDLTEMISITLNTGAIIEGRVLSCPTSFHKLTAAHLCLRMLHFL